MKKYIIAKCDVTPGPFIAGFLDEEILYTTKTSKAMKFIAKENAMCIQMALGLVDSTIIWEVGKDWREQ